MARRLILSINPGTTTTRCAVFGIEDDGLSPVAEQNLDHAEAELSQFPTIPDQLSFRADCVDRFLKDSLQSRDTLVAVAGRGGMLTPVPSGVIAVNDELVDFALHTPVYVHSSNLGAPLAQSIAKPLGVPAFVVDPVSVDELPPVARVSGFPEIPRFSFVHALNIRACARRLARQLDKRFDDLRVVVAHLGAGFSIATILGGKIVESSNRMEASPFSPERCGGLPPLPLIELCYSGKYEKPELLKKLYGDGGVFAYLGTKDIRKVEQMITEGDQQAQLVYDAMLYQVTKTIGSMAAVASFDLDGIILTGGLVNSPIITERLTKAVQRVAPVSIFPGSDECLALAEGAARAISSREKPMQWPVSTSGTTA